MNEEKTLENYSDEIKSLQRKQMQLVVDADKLAKELQEATEKYYKLSDEYVKVVCPQCGGTSITKDENGTNIKCPICQMKGFLYMKKFTEVIK